MADQNDSLHPLSSTHRFSIRSTRRAVQTVSLLDMKTRWIHSLLPALLFLCAISGAAVRQDDESLAERLLGTWEGLDKENPKKVVLEATYTPDGFVAGFVLGVVQRADGTLDEVKIPIRCRWRVRDGYLHTKDFETKPPGLWPNDFQQRYRITSLSDDEIVFATDQGEELRRKRKRTKQPQQEGEGQI